MLRILLLRLWCATIERQNFKRMERPTLFSAFNYLTPREPVTSDGAKREHVFEFPVPCSNRTLACLPEFVAVSRDKTRGVGGKKSVWRIVGASSKKRSLKRHHFAWTMNVKVLHSTRLLSRVGVDVVLRVHPELARRIEARAEEVIEVAAARAPKK